MKHARAYSINNTTINESLGVNFKTLEQHAIGMAQKEFGENYKSLKVLSNVGDLSVVNIACEVETIAIYELNESKNK